jgi:hypothetical protein
MSDLLPHSRRLARRFRGLWILLGLVVIALVVAVAGFFFARQQIGEFLAGKLGDRLAEDGVFIGWKSADWVPGGGVRLHGLAVYRDAAKHDRLALLGLVTARRPEPSFLRWDKMNFKAADTQILLGSGVGETRLEHLDMLLLAQPGKADLPECHASLQGLRIEAKCAFVALTHGGNAEAVAAARQVVQREGLFREVNLDWLKSVKEGLKFQPEKDQPVLRMDLYSLPDDRGMESTMTFDGAKFQWLGQRWDFMQAAVKIPVGKKNSNSPIEIDHVRIGHAGRKAEIAGAFDPASRVIRIRKFDSGIDALALARAMMPGAVGSLSAVSTSGDGRVSGAGEIPMDHPENFRWNGHAALDGELVYARGQTNIALQKPTFSVRVEEKAVIISDLKAGLWDGSLDVARLQVHLPSNEKKLRFEAQLKLGGSRLQSIINSFSEAPSVVPLNWKGAWRISGTAEIPMDQLGNFRWNGDMALDGELVYASGQTNIALQKPTFSMRVEEQAVTISDLKAGLWDGSLDVARLQVHLPSKEKKLRIETQLTLNGTRSSSVRKSFSAGQKQPRVVRLNWNGAWRGSAAGEIPVDHPENFRWHGEMALGGDLFYASGKTKVALQRPTFSVRVEKQVVSISNFKAGLWEGSFNAPKTLVYLPSAKKKARFETQFAIKDARLQSIINSFGGAQKEPGVVQCDWQGGGEFDLASLAGSGALSIGEADFGRVPIVGPLHFVFNILAPRFHTDEPSTMTVNHRMAGSILYLEDLKLVSEHAHVEAGGNIDLAHESTQLHARGGLRKLPGLITVLFTWLLEFKGEGPVDNVRWSIKGFPGFHPIVNAPKKTTRTADAAEKEADRAVKGLIELPGKVLEDE